ncbi:putative mitochondrial hypothetical protein [Leptomonas pyrrhocoris]|uniref:Uncharacterized protein n=1 Tax=Leptomonas pyrrhocoris TaxID=157538 RepID=A0A0M9G2A5_LEPPY|nr:putative mitochondrial hypothetical protein [Leptomonas pyrrhocoris]KPA80895.1 putative mitochondrial hypothetical protein [Leptomonas pyrrhocoris]|eukprot:XP_015659334.1 putative mitochondrial hypothetical protein [Leptomonas pyrrhocoris]
MLRVSRVGFTLVTAGAIKQAATTLNSLLDISGGKTPVPRDELKAFLKGSVMPIMAGTELDRRGNSSDLRSSLGQLTRDAAFAATIVNANPDANFVRSITACITHDYERMRFVSKMTSAQASKTIEYLCKVGVKNAAVFPVLISRLDYSNLHELARVMLALAESQLHELNMLVVVPLYCGDKWAVEVHNGSSGNSSSSETASASQPARSSNVFEAVRVLRALSKSCRKCVEDRRSASSHSLAELPRDSLHLLRNNLVKFIFEHGRLLRGSHWVNVARALILFPGELSELRQLAVVCPQIVEEVQVACFGGAKLEDPRSCPVTCETVASAAIRHVFDYAEHRREIPKESAEKHPSGEFPFDLSYPDLVKLLPMLEQIASGKAAAAKGSASEQDARVMTALNAISVNAHHLLLRDLVKVLQTLRRMPPSEGATAAVNVIAALVGSRLCECPPAELVQKVSFRTIAQFAATLSALRVTRCDDFVSFVSRGATFFPRSLTVETTVSFANALANAASNRSASCHAAMRTLLGRLVNNYEEELQVAPLVSAHPHAVTKILRACVLLDYIPETRLLERLLGSAEVPIQFTSDVHDAGGALVFGLTRTMTHFLRQARSECPQRVEELWAQNVLRTLLPLAVECTKHAATRVSATRWDGVAAYTAVSWRSTLEMLTAFVDPSLAHNTAEETAQRLVEAFPLCAELLTDAASMTRSQIGLLAKSASSATDLRHRLQQTSFNSTCPVHFLSSLLIFEYLVYQAGSQSSSPKSTAVSEDLKVRLTSLKDAAYAALLNSPVQEGILVTPMDVVHSIFDCPLSKTDAAASSSSTSDPTAILLSKRDALEITTNLPFALSLVMNPGPVNEYFTERCMSLMVSEDDA